MADNCDIMPICKLIHENFFDYAKLGIWSVLGVGLSGTVVLAQSATVREDWMAVKVFEFTNSASVYKEKYGFFAKEVWAMQRLNHPHLLKGRLAAVSPKSLYISMEYFPNGSLDTKLTTLTFAQIERYLVQLASAVKYMHDNGVTHCDIKLPNILVRSAETVVLADFGLCLLLPEGNKIALINIGGSLAYMGPERRINQADFEIDATKNDVYALGVVLWGLVFGRNPEKGSYNYLETTKRCTNIPELLKFCMMNMLDDDPAERIGSADLFETLKQRSQWKNLAEELPIFQPSPPKQMAADQNEISPLEVILSYIEQNRNSNDTDQN